MGFSCGTVCLCFNDPYSLDFKSLCIFCAGIKIVSNILTCCHDDGLLKTAFIRFIVKDGRDDALSVFKGHISTGKEQTEDKIQ